MTNKKLFTFSAEIGNKETAFLAQVLLSFVFWSMHVSHEV